MPLHCGLLAGEVAICAGCNVVAGWAAFVTGVFSGLIYLGIAKLMEILELDDPVEAVPVHFGGGVSGLFTLAFLHPDMGIFYHWNNESGLFLAWQICGMVVLFAWHFVLTLLVMFLIRLAGFLYAKSDLSEVNLGIDDIFHESAYPEIKALQIALGASTTQRSQFPASKLDDHHQKKN